MVLFVKGIISTLDGACFTARTLLQVFMIAYCRGYRSNDYVEYKSICQAFVRAVEEVKPEFMRKSKIHLLLHLPDNLSQFGPTASYNTERLVVHQIMDTLVCHVALSY